MQHTLGHEEELHRALKLEKKRGKSDLITKMYLQGIYNKRQSSMSKGQEKCCMVIYKE